MQTFFVYKKSKVKKPCVGSDTYLADMGYDYLVSHVWGIIAV